MTLTAELRDQVATAFRTVPPIDNLFLFEQMPARKLRGATGSYAGGRSQAGDEDLIALYDDTVFGSAKEGFLLTSRRLYAKNMMESPVSVDLDDITAITMTGGLTKKLQVRTRIGDFPMEVTANARTAELRDSLQRAIQILSRTLVPAVVHDNAMHENAMHENAMHANAMHDDAAPAARNCPHCGAVSQVHVCEYCDSRL